MVNPSRNKGTRGENHFLPMLRILFGEQVERAPLKGVLDHGDYTGVPWLHEAKHTHRPLFQQWARVANRKAGIDWVILWKGDTRLADAGQGPLVCMPLAKYVDLVQGL